MKRTQDPEEQGPVLKKARMTPDNENATQGSKPGGGSGSEEGPASTWTKVEKRKKKKTVKTEAKNDSVQPRFLYSNHEIVKRKGAIGIEEIRDLILHLIADGPNPNWLRVENGQQVQRVVALMVPGLTNQLLSLPPIPTSATTNPNVPLSIPLLSPASVEGTAAAIPFIATTFSHACPTRAPGDQNRMHSVLSTFFNCPISAEEKKRKMNQRLKSERPKNDPTQYLLTMEQMIDNDYPIPSYMADIFQKPTGWLETPEHTSPETAEVKRKIYAIDCEMCITEDGKELTRVCVIDFYSDNVVYDQLVKPSKPIIDYLTRFSGITEQHLAPISTTLADVQTKILALLSPPSPNPFSSNAEQTAPPTPILIGHSLESDLKALKICHPYCIDTALMYHHPRGRPLKPGLAWLTKKWCGKEIQSRGEGGHDPEEDARACLDLLRKKLEEGPGFGEFKTDQESIFERFSRARRRGDGGVRSAVVDYGNPAQMHGSKATTAIAAKSDGEVVDGLLGAIPSHDFAFGRLMGLADQLGWITQRSGPDTGVPPPPPAPPTEDQLIETLKTLNDHLQKLYSSLPPRTAVILFTGHSDPRRMTQLNSRKGLFENALRSGKKPEELGDLKWSAADGRELEEAVELTRRGLVFLGIKM